MYRIICGKLVVQMVVKILYLEQIFCTAIFLFESKTYGYVGYTSSQNLKKIMFFLKREWIFLFVRYYSGCMAELKEALYKQELRLLKKER